MQHYVAVRKDASLTDSMPSISFIGYPIAIPCIGHAGLGFREVSSANSRDLIDHFAALPHEDRRMRFCATLNQSAVDRHVAGLWTRRTLVLGAFDGPLWRTALRQAGQIRAVAELSLGEREAELGISVDAALRRRGVGTYLVQTAAHLLAPRGISQIRAYTLPGNRSFIALAEACGADIEGGPDEVAAFFDVATLQRAYLRRRTHQVLWPKPFPSAAH